MEREFMTVADLITWLQTCDPKALVCEERTGDLRGLKKEDCKYQKKAREVDLEAGHAFDDEDLYTGPLVTFRSWE